MGINMSATVAKSDFEILDGVRFERLLPLGQCQKMLFVREANKFRFQIEAGGCCKRGDICP